MGFGYANFATASSEYLYIDNGYALNVTLAPSGTLEMTDIPALAGSSSFISSEMRDDGISSVIEKDGLLS